MFKKILIVLFVFCSLSVFSQGTEMFDGDVDGGQLPPIFQVEIISMETTLVYIGFELEEVPALVRRVYNCGFQEALDLFNKSGNRENLIISMTRIAEPPTLGD